MLRHTIIVLPLARGSTSPVRCGVFHCRFRPHVQQLPFYVRVILTKITTTLVKQQLSDILAGATREPESKERKRRGEITQKKSQQTSPDTLYNHTESCTSRMMNGFPRKKELFFKVSTEISNLLLQALHPGGGERNKNTI